MFNVLRLPQLHFHRDICIQRFADRTIGFYIPATLTSFVSSMPEHLLLSHFVSMLSGVQPSAPNTIRLPEQTTFGAAVFS